jgi:hypothetical protein
MKEFAGVIKDWSHQPNGIKGKIVWHLRHNPSTTEFAPGHRLMTSKVVKADAFIKSNFTIVETENSFYVLLGDARSER